ncbi:MAG: DUF6452 family protein [Muribaculaceae bacterium]|nr:DUF6452 family protein [Muribaculaceae bacterium]
MASTPQPYSIVLDTIRIAGIGAPSDSVLSYYSAQEAYLPFNNDSHITAYVLEYNRMPPELFDTITFEYDPNPWFESTDCGVFYKYDIQHIAHTTHFIDSITCPGGVIDNTPGQNIFVYLRVGDTSTVIARRYE